MTFGYKMIGQRGAVFVDLHMVAMSQKLALFIVSAFFVGIVSSGKGGQGRERRSLVHYAQGDAIQDGRPSECYLLCIIFFR